MFTERANGDRFPVFNVVGDLLIGHFVVDGYDTDA